LEGLLRLAFKLEKSFERGALSPTLELPLSHPNALLHLCLTKNIAGLGGIFHRAEGSSKGGAQWNCK